MEKLQTWKANMYFKSILPHIPTCNLSGYSSLFKKKKKNGGFGKHTLLTQLWKPFNLLCIASPLEALVFSPCGSGNNGPHLNIYTELVVALSLHMKP